MVPIVPEIGECWYNIYQVITLSTKAIESLMKAPRARGWMLSIVPEIGKLTFSYKYVARDARDQPFFSFPGIETFKISFPGIPGKFETFIFVTKK